MKNGINLEGKRGKYFLRHQSEKIPALWLWYSCAAPGNYTLGTMLRFREKRGTSIPATTEKKSV